MDYAELPQDENLFLAPQPETPEGYVLVPKEPTTAMNYAGVESVEYASIYGRHVEQIYKAMVSAAQGE